MLTSPLLTVALTVQPDVITGLAAKPQFRGRGLLGRFFYALPKSRVGSRNANPPPVPVEVTLVYDGAVSKLLAMSSTNGNGIPEPVVLHLDEGARRRLLTFKAELEPRLGPAGDLHPMADWGNKLVGNTARIAGLLHVADHADRLQNMPKQIPVSAVERAILVAHYAIEHARAAFGAMAADPAAEDAKYVLAWIRGQEKDRLSRRDIHRGVQARLPKAANLDPALAVLEQRGYIRPVLSECQGRGRPPSPDYDVNPLARGA